MAPPQAALRRIAGIRVEGKTDETLSNAVSHAFARHNTARVAWTRAVEQPERGDNVHSRIWMAETWPPKNSTRRTSFHSYSGVSSM